jgi:HlyD family secretion protein
MTVAVKKRNAPAGLWVAVAVVALGGWGWHWHAQHAAPKNEFRTAVIKRGEVSSSVSSTGTVNAVFQVEVGSQDSGIIQKMFIDYNSVVKKNQPLAQLDPSTFQAAVDQAQAQVNNAQANYYNQVANVGNMEAALKQAEAGISNAQATVEASRATLANAKGARLAALANVNKARADLDNAKLTYDRNVILLKKNLIARSDLDTARTAWLDAQATLQSMQAQYAASQASERSAAANVNGARSNLEAAVMKRDAAAQQLQSAREQVKGAAATVKQYEATLRTARVNLAQTVIRAPIDGIVLDKKVQVGTTVASSFSVPDLFTMTEDLTKMEVDTNVDEADVGSVKLGAEATFTVDAYPNDTFTGKVRQIRQAPVTVSNVVTYVVVIAYDNKDLKLKPGMTATVSIHVDTKKDVLLVPNAALRFRPAPELVSESGPRGASGESGAPGESGASGETGASGGTGVAGESGAPSAWPSPGAGWHHRHRGGDGDGGSGGAGAAGAYPAQHHRDGDHAGGHGGHGHQAQHVYVVDPQNPDKVREMRVRVGISDGTNSEIVRSRLKEGDSVIIGLGGPDASPSSGPSRGNNRPPGMRGF